MQLQKNDENEPLQISIRDSLWSKQLKPTDALKDVRSVAALGVWLHVFYRSTTIPFERFVHLGGRLGKLPYPNGSSSELMSDLYEFPYIGRGGLGQPRAPS